ncbi:MAG: hypothetical protein LBT04_00225 [Prevotellaceae bacterium]|jgi:hypothetical protein|nr:hypothetical protein [Prevotellaceae bacterium]
MAYNWGNYKKDVDDLASQAEEQNEILAKAGLSDADDLKQQEYMEDYWARKRERRK